MNEGDRMCPSCDTESLIEKGLSDWICLNPSCGKLFSEKDLDDGDENFHE